VSTNKPVTVGPNYDFSRMATSTDARNRAIALNVEVETSMYKIHHSMVIADVALAIADQVEAQEHVKLDRFVIEMGALLHDIGISQTIDDSSPEHGMIGANMVREAGYPEAVARCIEFHDCGGFVAEIIAELGLQTTTGKQDTVPETWEEKIAVYADFVVSFEGEYLLDIWNDPISPAKAIHPYFKYLYQHRRGLAFPMNHPELYYVNKFNQEMIRYCPRAMYETYRPGINRMLRSMVAEGIPIPPRAPLAQWP
jgi:putative nucleotidyltransferase with HDIG domain